MWETGNSSERVAKVLLKLEKQKKFADMKGRKNIKYIQKRKPGFKRKRTVSI